MESDIGKITFTWLSSLSLPSILIGLGAAALVAKLVRAQQAKGAYWARITARRAQLAERRRNLEEILLIGGVLVTPEREEILRLGIEELLARLKSDQLHPVAVLQAYQAKAVAVNEEINAVCDFILEATEQAEALALLPPEERGPLHGLPLSVKECFLLAGYDSTIGMGKLIGLKSPKDCSVIEMLKAQGAVPFCLTNVPQTMVSFGCSNPVYGTTKNPHKLDRTPGGSSGGEGALLAAGGSILGLGSDLGGSVRVPAHMSGVCGLKPTSGRIFEGGRRGGVGSGGPVVRNGVYGVSGFMSSSVKGLEVVIFHPTYEFKGWDDGFAGGNRKDGSIGLESGSCALEESLGQPRPTSEDWVLHQRRNLSSNSRDVKGSPGNCGPAQESGT